MSVKRQSLLMTVMVVLGLVFAVSFFSNAFSQSDAAPRGPFMIAGGDKMMVWRIDQATGLISYCQRDTISMDPQFIKTRPPICSAWGG